MPVLRKLRQILKLRQVETEVGTSTLLVQEASWTNEGGVQVTHIVNFKGYPPDEDRIYISPEEMDKLAAWWQAQEKKES